MAVTVLVTEEVEGGAEGLGHTVGVGVVLEKI
jgi:hypothetical protein